MLVNFLLLLSFLAVAFAGIPSISWQSVAIDASGKYHVAAAAYNNEWDQGYPLYISDDYGVNWKTTKSPTYDWRNTYSDTSGKILIAYAVYNSFAVGSTPPLYISQDRGITWTTGISTSSFPVTNNIIDSDSTSNTTSLWSVVNSRLYHSVDLGKNWNVITNIPSKYGTAYTAAIGPDMAIDKTGKFVYVSCDGGFCVSRNNGQTYSSNYTMPVNSIKTDPSGMYVFVLTDKILQYSADYGYTWVTLKDYSASGSPTVTKTFLAITSDHANVFTLEKSSTGTTSLVRTYVSTKSSYNLFSTANPVSDAAVSANGNAMIISTSTTSSTTPAYLFTSQNSGTTWTTHDLS